MSLKKIRISIQGYEGSFHHIAATYFWGKEIELVMRSSFKEVFDDVESSYVEYSLAAVENTIAGSVVDTLDLLQKRDVSVIGEIILHIQQNLIVIPGTRLKDLTRVYSHPVALQQCLDFFSQYPQISLVSTDDTGRSVDLMMKKGDKTAGSVASTLAAKIFNAEVLQPSIETNKENFTRFFVLSSTKNKVKKLDGEVKTSLILEVPHKVGALAGCLKVIADNECNLLKIESRPIQGAPWEYSIYLDMISTHTHSQRQEILKKIGASSDSLKILGSYTPGKTYQS